MKLEIQRYSSIVSGLTIRVLAALFFLVQSIIEKGLNIESSFIP